MVQGNQIYLNDKISFYYNKESVTMSKLQLLATYLYPTDTKPEFSTLVTYNSLISDD